MQNGKILYERVNGFADMPNEIPNTLGKLLDIPLNDIDKDVTVKQLLNHTSGVPDYFDESIMDEYEELWVDYPNYKIRHNSDLLPLFINKPMMYPKGEKFQYNNSGYVLLAMIIEKVTRMYFDWYHKENIFSVDAKGTGAGGAFITVKDIISFWTNLLEGKLISKELVSDMLSKQSGDGANAEEGYYGYGMWIIDNPNGRDLAYFQGCDPGVSFISEYNPNNGIISVLVSNYGDNVWREMRKIREVLY